MAQRLATVYVKACLELSEAELDRFIRLFAEHQTSLQVKVLEGGNPELGLPDEAEVGSVLPFERKSGMYVFRGSFQLTNPQTANIMRKAVSLFRGNAVVHRMYSGFTMVYEYEKGSVVKIAEVKNGLEKVVYAYENKLGKLEQLYRKTDVEAQIGRIFGEINQLLDLRNKVVEEPILQRIDERLGGLTQRLFVLEA